VSEDLLQQLRARAPWHMDVALTEGVSSGDGNEATGGDADRAFRVSLIKPQELQPLLLRLYPNGLGGKRFLDCACNAAGYSLLASDLGAEYCFAFDVREHWIEQARFLKRHLGKTDDQVRVEVCDLLEVDRRLASERFDICLFKGIFYHLPDPVAGLKIVADRTDEVLILDSAAVTGHDDGFLKLSLEGVEHPMSGVHHLAWRPTGPAVLCRILEWLGFEATRVVFWQQKTRRPDYGRIRIVGARDASLLAGLASSVLLPANGDTVSGTCVLDADASGHGVDVDRVEFRVTGGDRNDDLAGVAAPSPYGWIHLWDTTTVPNGTYTLHTVVVDIAGNIDRGKPITLTVEN
jgi:tRNA (mo5U34)-methyltransferase